MGEKHIIMRTVIWGNNGRGPFFWKLECLRSSSWRVGGTAATRRLQFNTAAAFIL